MSARKTERLMNLLILLLSSRAYLPKHQLRASVADYREARSDEAFEKMFERDKDDLRALGIPVEMGSFDPLFEDEAGYRVQRAEFELPQIALTAEEAAVVGLAARVWQHQELAATTQDALRKLATDGVDIDAEAHSLFAPQLAADEPAFLAVLDAISARRPVSFGYRARASAEVQQRHLEPWGVVGYRGRWYVVGFDRDRDDRRVFRLGRIEGEVEAMGEGGSYELPADLDIHAAAVLLAPDVPDQEAVLRVRVGHAIPLRGRAGGEAEPVDDSWERLRVPYGRTDLLVAEVCELADAVVVESPAELRAAVLERLRAAAGVGR